MSQMEANTGSGGTGGSSEASGLPTTTTVKYGFDASWLALMILLPPLVYWMWICMAYHQGNMYFPRSYADLVTTVKRVPGPSTAAVAFLFSWFGLQALLQIFAPGEWVPGTPLRDGTRLKYKMNGWPAFWVTMLG